MYVYIVILNLLSYYCCCSNLIMLYIIKCITITPLRSIRICFTFVSHSAAQLFSFRNQCLYDANIANTIYVIHSY